MDVILLERIAKLGQMGETVKVRDGYARNFLLPQGKALRSNAANKARFESERATLEARNLERKSEAQKIASALEGKSFIVVRAAGETGQLYGSVAARDIVDVLAANGFTIGRNQVDLNNPIKEIGLHNVTLHLHGEVEIAVELNVAALLKKPSVRQRAKASPPLMPSMALTKTHFVRKTSSIRKQIATKTKLDCFRHFWRNKPRFSRTGVFCL